MTTLPFLTWMGNAAAVLVGCFGDVTRQVRQAGCSRQTAYQHAAKVLHAVTQAHASGPSRDELMRELQRLQEENRQLWQALDMAIDFPESRQRRFAVQAAALGISLT